MSKAVLISIRPKWCELIANGEKTIEVRKTAPKIETPFKCYIYCTKPSFEYEDFIPLDNGRFIYGGGKVIGEFVCDSIFPLSVYASDASFFDTWPPLPVPGTCLSDKEIAEYLGNGKTGYGWHISNLVFYDVPKKLSDFRLYNTSAVIEYGLPMPTHEIRRPPQSYCYVEEMT